MYIVPHVVGLQWFQDYSCWGGWGGGEVVDQWLMLCRTRV